MGGKAEGEFTVEQWDDAGRKCIEIMAWAGNLLVARAAFDVALTQRPGGYVILCHGARIIAKSPLAERLLREQAIRGRVGP
ncbi:hypothetical protein V5F41_12200 [Xanthobacter autotrophicus]|uniref:hypothetical protein n=1 Tax=Xanthobacter autotrophicus TaxID=280 RepID=UPI003727AEC4